MLTREFVLSFREATPYINTFRGRTIVIAINGETVAGGHFASLAQDINVLTSLGVRIVLVHGARPQIESMLKQRGLARLFHRQRRVTDFATLESVKQASGAVRHDIEAALSMGMPNSSMHGAHLRVAGGNYLTAQPLGVIDGVDMQYTGQLRKLDVTGVRQRLEAGELVLLSPIGYSLTGEAFNLAMEDVATHVAITLKAEKLIFFVGGPGATTADGNRISTLTAQQAEEFLESTTPPDDVATYLPCAIRATRDGVPRAHLINGDEDGALLAELFTHGGAGTMVARDPLVKVRTASMEDIGDVLALIRPLEEHGILVKRSLEHLEMDINNYSVLEHDGKVYGCVAMHTFDDAPMAELACLAVSPEKRDSGYGEMLLRHVEYQARTRGIVSLFVLTTQTAHWFVERGFSEAQITHLPLTRQRLYNYQRRSKVFVKAL